MGFRKDPLYKDVMELKDSSSLRRVLAPSFSSAQMPDDVIVMQQLQASAPSIFLTRPISPARSELEGSSNCSLLRTFIMVGNL